MEEAAGMNNSMADMPGRYDGNIDRLDKDNITGDIFWTLQGIDCRGNRRGARDKRR